MKHSLKDNLSNEFLEIFIKQNLRGFEKKSYFTLVGISKNETLFLGEDFQKPSGHYKEDFGFISPNYPTTGCNSRA